MDRRLAFSLSVLGTAVVLRALLTLGRMHLARKMDRLLQELEVTKRKAESMGKYYQRFTYTLEESTTLKEMSRLLENVKKRIYVTSGWISHDSIIAALLSNRQKDVRVVMKPPEKRGFETPDVNTTNEVAVNEFREHIDYRLCKEVHAKTMIIDDTLVLGSTNFTNQGFSKNAEANVITEDPKLVEGAEEFFQKVWEKVNVSRASTEKRDGSRHEDGDWKEPRTTI